MIYTSNTKYIQPPPTPLEILGYLGGPKVDTDEELGYT